MNLELLTFFLIFIVSLVLILKDFKMSLVVLLILSVFLHKELFELYRWDLMPIRAIMLAYTVFGIYKLFKFGSIGKIISFCKEPYILLLLLLLVSKAVSILFSKNIGASVSLTAFFATVTVLGIILFIYLKNKPAETLSLIKIYILVVFVSCLFGYFQFFVYENYHVLLGAIWNIPNNLPRIGALFWDVNHFGALLASLLPVLGTFFLLSLRTKKTLISAITYAVMLMAMSGILILTNSRTAWITAAVALVTFLIVLFVRRFGSKGVLAVLLSIVVVSTPFAIQYADKSSAFRALVRNYFHYRMDSFDSHILLIRGAFEIFGKYPVLGSGVGSFFEHFSDTKVAAEYFSRDPAALNTRVPAHTIWGELASETGILGLGLYILFIAFNLFSLLYVALKNSDKEKYLLSSAMFSAVLGLLVAGVFYSYNAEFFWIILFLYFMYGIGVLAKEYNPSYIVRYFVAETPLPVLFLFLVAFILIFWNLGGNHLIPWDEAIYANVSKNMTITGNYLVQYWWPATAWYEKPPLYMWFTAGLMKVLGQSEWAVRLPSAIMGFLTVVAVYFFGKWVFKLSNEKKSNFSNKTVGFIAALCLLTTVHFLYYSRIGMLDVSATFFITLSLFVYYVSKVSLNKRRLILFMMAGALCGLAVMVKGIIGLLPIPIIGIYEFYLYFTKQQKFSKEFVKTYAIFFGAAFVIFAPWHLYMTYVFGFEFWQKYIGYHVIDRALVSIEDKGRPFLWYFEVLRVSMRLWFLALVGAIPVSLFIVLRHFSKKFNFGFVESLLEGYEDSKAPHKHLVNAHVFLLIWSIFSFLLFSASASKLIWYIIPIYPAIALLIGFFTERVINVLMYLMPIFKTAIFKPLVVFILMCGIFTYLYVYKYLVYTSDLTGSQVQLILQKDAMFGTKSKTYADRIELPLLLFYSKSPFVVTDFGPLRYKLTMSTSYNEDVYFITKESRLRSYREILPQVELRTQINEWVLGELPSAYSIDKNHLKTIIEELDALNMQILRAIQARQSINYEKLQSVNELKMDIQTTQIKIDKGLKTVVQVQ